MGETNRVILATSLVPVNSKRPWADTPLIHGSFVFKDPDPSALYDFRNRLIRGPSSRRRKSDRTCDMKSVDLADNRLHDAIRTARGCAA